MLRLSKKIYSDSSIILHNCDYVAFLPPPAPPTFLAPWSMLNIMEEKSLNIDLRGGGIFIIYIPGARGDSVRYFLKWWYFPRALARGKYHHWRKYFTESPERRVYKWYIIPKIKNFRKNKLLSSSSWTYLREYDALKYKIASSLFIFITRSTENSL